MLKYKLTNQDNTTYNNTKWEIGKSIETNGKIKKLCTNSWLHFYHTPELAVLLNPIHADINYPKLYEVEVEGEILDNDHGLKAGCTKMTLIREIEKPVFIDKQLVSISLEFVKYCSDYNNEKVKIKKQQCIDLIEKYLIDQESITKQELIALYDNFCIVKKSTFNEIFVDSLVTNDYFKSYDIASSDIAYNTMLVIVYICYEMIYYSNKKIGNIINYSSKANPKTDYIKLQEIINKGIQNAKI